MITDKEYDRLLKHINEFPEHLGFTEIEYKDEQWSRKVYDAMAVDHWKLMLFDLIQLMTFHHDYWGVLDEK